MPFALGFIGIILIVAGARGTYGDLKNLLVQDFSGEGNFFYWIVALGAVGMIGYVPGLERFSRSFMALIFLAMMLRNGTGFFSRFMEALGTIGAGGNSGVAPAAPVAPSAAPQTSGGSEASVPNGVEEMNKRFGKPPEWATGMARWLFGAQ